MGAKGDGQTDDTAALNHILSAGSEFVSHSVHPVGRVRNIRHAGRPGGLSDHRPSLAPDPGHRLGIFLRVGALCVAVRVGRSGSVGVVEIQGLVFTVQGRPPARCSWSGTFTNRFRDRPGFGVRGNGPTACATSRCGAASTCIKLT